MSVKPIIEIPVDDAAFKRFLELFDNYRADVETMPDAWKTLESAMGDATTALTIGALESKGALADTAAAAGIISIELRKAVDAQHSLGAETKRTGHAMESLRAKAKGVVAGLASVGGWIGKIASLAGLGGILGLVTGDVLAQSAFRQNVASGRLGLPIGLKASFDVNAQQFLPDSALGAAQTAQQSGQRYGAFGVLGISVGQAQHLNAADLALTELIHAATILRGTYTRNQPLGLTAAGLAYQQLGGNISDIVNALQPGNLARLKVAKAQTDRDAGSLNITRSAANAASDLKIALDKARVQIENTLINGLAPLAPEIAGLASSIAQGVQELVGSHGFAEAVHIATLALDKMTRFMAGVNWKALGTALGDVSDIAALLFTPGKSDRDHLFPPILPKGAADWVSKVEDSLSNGFQTFFGIAGPSRKAVFKAIARASAVRGVDPVLAAAAAEQESGFATHAKGDFGWFDKAGGFHPDDAKHPKNKNSHYTSFGLYQLHEHGELGNMTRKQAYDPYLNSLVALKNFAIVAKAHPHWSPGHIALVAQGADPDNGKYVRDVNREYESLILHGYGLKLEALKAHYEGLIKAGAPPRAQRAKRPASVHVTVKNSTSSRVTVSANGSKTQ